MLVAAPVWSGAHEIPSSVTVLAYVRPEGRTLSLLVRVPLEAMRDVDFPMRGPGYLDLDAVAPLLPDAAKLWIADAVEIRENGRRLEGARIVATRVSLPSDRSFATWEDARSHVTGEPMDAATLLVWQQAMMDVLIEYPIESATSDFSIRPELARLGVRTTTVLRFLPPDRGERVFSYDGDPGLVRLDPSWHHAAIRFVRLGFVHILDGIDHLLFLLCLVIPFRRFRPLVLVVTSFTVAHSITLIASAAGFAPRALWFPPLIETLIAASIVWMALENIVGAKVERRWLYAFGFGLVHGFGFSFALRESLQFAGSHLATSLFAFNVGVELGQLLVIALLVPLLAFVFRRVVAERMGVIVLSAIVAHTGWHWMLDRGGTLSQYDFTRPVIDLAFVAAAMRALMLLAIVGAALWLLRAAFGRLADVSPATERTGGVGIEG
jgi:hypothetical protein